MNAATGDPARWFGSPAQWPFQDHDAPAAEADGWRGRAVDWPSVDLDALGWDGRPGRHAAGQ